MSIMKKIISMALYLSFFFCVLYIQNGWSSGFSADEIRDISSFPLRACLEEEIPVFPKDAFENLGVRPGGTTLSSSMFKEKATGKEWIGKSQSHATTDAMELDQEINESLACRERIASDIYGLYGVAVPRTVLSRQQVSNTGIEALEGREVMHIMSCKVEGYHDYRNQVRFAGFGASPDPDYGFIVCHDSRCTIDECKGAKEGSYATYKTVGIGRTAAVATWIHDIDYIGASATNTGYRIVNRGTQVVAELVLVDPGEAFSDPTTFPYPASRHIRFAMPGTDDTHTIAFERLCPDGSLVRNEFLMTLHAIIDTDERAVVRFFTRRGAEFFVSRDPRSVPGLTRQLMDRKRQLAIDYAPELAASRAKYEELKACTFDAANPTVPRLLGDAIPDIARGHKDIYLRFIKGSLVYKPNKDNDIGKIELRIADLLNPLESTFDISGCGDAETRLSISTGYRKGLKMGNAGKIEIWIVPKFVIEKELATTASHLLPVMESFSAAVGLFWTWGNWDNLGCYDYLVDQTMEEITLKNFYSLGINARPARLGISSYSVLMKPSEQPHSFVFNFG